MRGAYLLHRGSFNGFAAPDGLGKLPRVFFGAFWNIHGYELDTATGGAGDVSWRSIWGHLVYLLSFCSR